MIVLTRKMYFYHIILCGFLLVRDIQSEVGGGNPAEQNVKDDFSSTPKSNQLTKLVNDYDKLTLDIMSVPSVKQGENVFQEMCQKNGGNNSFEGAMQAMKSVRECFAELITYAQLPARIRESRPFGELDTVFKDYCQKTDAMKGCVNKFLVEVDPCLAENQKSSKYTVQNITEAILKFVCENEGDHIALFISEKGPDCILSKQEGIKKCMQEKIPDNKTKTVFDNMNSTDIDAFNFTTEEERVFSLSFELEHCRTAYQVRKCIVNELTTCPGSTPANVVDSIFNLIHNSTTCSKFKMEEIDPEGFNTGASLFTSMFSVILPAVTVLLVRTFNS